MTSILDVPEIRARVHLFTVADYRALAEENPAFAHSELLRGVIVEKEEETPAHVFLRHAAAEALRHGVRGPWRVRQKVTLLLADSVPEPDVAAVHGEEEDLSLDHSATAALVVEVAVASLPADREKAALYAEAGVAEYWIVLAEAQQVEVYRQPEGGVYQEIRTYRRGEVIEGVGVIGGAFAVEGLFK